MDVWLFCWFIMIFMSAALSQIMQCGILTTLTLKWVHNIYCSLLLPPFMYTWSFSNSTAPQLLMWLFRQWSSTRWCGRWIRAGQVPGGGAKGCPGALAAQQPCASLPGNLCRGSSWHIRLRRGFGIAAGSEGSGEPPTFSGLQETCEVLPFRV